MTRTGLPFLALDRVEDLLRLSGRERRTLAWLRGRRRSSFTTRRRRGRASSAPARRRGRRTSTDGELQVPLRARRSGLQHQRLAEMGLGFLEEPLATGGV